MKANQNIQKKEITELKSISSLDTTKTEDENMRLGFCSIVNTCRKKLVGYRAVAKITNVYGIADYFQ